MQSLPSRLIVTWLGHATVLIELDGVKLLTDPLLRERIGPLVRIAPSIPPGVADRPDAVLISHLHADHADVPSLRSLGRGARVLAPRGAAGWLVRSGVANVRELAPGADTTVGEVRITATRAVHPGRRWPWAGAPAEAVGFLIEGSQGCYFAGDTDLFGEMVELRDRTDLALLPISGWGPRTGAGHLDPRRAAAAARMIAPRVAVPIHWGTLARRRPFRPPSDPAAPVRQFVRLMSVEAPAVQVRVLAPGGRTELAPADRTAAPHAADGA